MKLIKVIWANLAHATHAILNGLDSHRMWTHTVKPARKLLGATAQIKCECGKVFYEDKAALKLFDEIQGS
jgi:hypothetical protein